VARVGGPQVEKEGRVLSTDGREKTANGSATAVQPRRWTVV
jgi:hypothetical protein